MKDRVPANPGRVLITPEDGSAAFYATMTRADNPTQEGDPLGKKTLLQDETAALFGLGTDAVPDDVLSFLGKYAQNIWKRRIYKEHYDATLSSGVNQYCLGGGSSTTVSNTIYYSDEIELDSSGATVLKNEQSIDVSYSNKDNSIVQSLPGKYIRNAKQSLPSNASRPSEVLYVDPSATISGSTGDGNTRYGVYISSKGAKIATAYLNPIVGEWEYIYSANRNAYPDSGESGGYEYQYLGIPLDNAVNAPKFEKGSYIGTGTYGVSNPCSLTFGFSPSILIITGFMKSSGTSIGGNGSVVMNISYGSYGESYSEYSIHGTVVANGNQVQWYSEGSASEQMNTDGSTYYYVAIG